jgi:hypothetical protein
VKPFSIFPRVLLGLLALSTFSSCSNNRSFLQEGSIAVTRTAPIRVAGFLTDTSLNNTKYLGFNTKSALIGEGLSGRKPWLHLDRASNLVSLVRDGKNTLSAFVSGDAKEILPGSYRLQYASDLPLWFANNSYFSIRSLPIPNESSKERFLSGAFGEAALFFEGNLVIHCSSIVSEEVGGFSIPCASLQTVLESLPVDSRLIIR